MQGDINVSVTQLKELLEDGHEVHTTVFDLGEATIELSSKRDISLLTVRGTYSAALAKEIDKVSLRCQGSVGLEFVEESLDAGVARPMAFNSTVLALLKTIKNRCERRGETFFICSPPPRLVDMLRLAGVYDVYQIIGDPRQTRSAPPRAAASKSEVIARSPSVQRSSSDRGWKEKQKRIVHLNHSLKRTFNLEKGLDSAEKCVQKLLPQEAPFAEGFSFAFSYRSSEKIGGDFFDFIDLAGNRLGLSLGDVSGHGIDAALVMGISKKLINIRALDPRFCKPSAVLRQVSQDLSLDLSRQTFVTAIYGILDVSTGVFQYARAGHENPILFRPGGEQKILRSRGVAIGPATRAFFASQIEDSSVRLAPGDCLLMCTDGLPECRNDKRGTFSRERLAFELTQIEPGQHSCEEILDHLLERILRYAAGHPQEDDMTAVLIQRLPETEPRGQPVLAAAAPLDMGVS
ncbi:MAG: PP2C family protein-serine/threonine phosphatase [Planctomycetes bacterium]|nr:PP2C family protein-serine/threonine phosphatase [Planctomycetota bacterium]